MEVKLPLKELKNNIKMSKRVYESNSGIYTITNLLNNKILVGYSNDFKKRKSQHFKELREGIHKNDYLQRAFNKDGEANFEFDVLEYYPDEGFILPSMENYWTNMLNTHNREFGYNLRPTNPYDKVIQTAETRKKMSEANKGKKWSEETRKIQSEQRLGKPSNISDSGRKSVGKAQEKPVIQYDLQMNQIQEWTSIKDAADTLCINLKSISGACHNRTNTYKGFIWRLKNTTNEN